MSFEVCVVSHANVRPQKIDPLHVLAKDLQCDLHWLDTLDQTGDFLGVKAQRNFLYFYGAICASEVDRRLPLAIKVHTQAKLVWRLKAPHHHWAGPLL